MIPAQLPDHRCLPEPQLIFDHVNNQARSDHPLRGLVSFGPYSKNHITGVMDPIRVALIGPSGATAVADRLLAELEQRHSPKERRQYLIDFTGFRNIFRVGVRRADNDCAIELANVDVDLNASTSPGTLLYDRISRALKHLQSLRDKFDVVMIYLPTHWERGFFGAGDDDFDLHDSLKAFSAACSIPIQLIREDKAIAYFCRCSVMWRLGIALYCKAGGIPWKLADIQPDTAYIGLSYALRPGSQAETQFVVCCSQIFDADGTGLEFVVYNAGELRVHRRNPFLSRTEFHRIMTRSLSIYQRRHAGLTPAKIVVHKTTEFKSDEVDGCFDAFQQARDIRLLQIKQNTPWRGIAINKSKYRDQRKGDAGRYPCNRGSLAYLGDRDILLWTQGNSPDVVGGADFFKEGKGIPHPIQLVRYAGTGSLDLDCAGTLGLTKMNWNHDGLYDRLPVTIGYASVLAQTIKRMATVESRPYQFRFFM
jgi:hypothetical protein